MTLADKDIADRTMVIEATRDEFVPRNVVNAQGAWVELADGRRLLDMHGQYMCVGVGHGHPRIRAALHRAVDGLDYICEVMSHDAKARAAELLVGETMEHSDWWGDCRFVSTGSEAVEMAMLVARTYMKRPEIVVAQSSYHGWTAGASSATSLPHLRNHVEEVDTGRIETVRTPHSPYHAAPSALYLETEDQIRECVAETERVIRAVGIHNVAGFMFEIYKGAAGYLVPDLYVQLIRDMTQRLGILWIDDEVIAGAGRTGRWWAFQHTGVQPDIVATAKGISSSAVPAGAVVVSRPIADYFAGVRWNCVSTNSGHPLAMAAVSANIEVVRDEEVLENVRELGKVLEQHLTELQSRHRCFERFSGRGFAWGLELVADPDTGRKWQPQDRWHTPGIDPAPELNPSQFVVDACEKRGVLLYSFLTNTVTLAPPLKLDRAELEFAMNVLDEALSELDARTS